MDKYFNVNFICATNNNEWWSNHALMSRQIAMTFESTYADATPPTND